MTMVTGGQVVKVSTTRQPLDMIVVVVYMACQCICDCRRRRNMDCVENDTTVQHSCVTTANVAELQCCLVVASSL